MRIIARIGLPLFILVASQPLEAQQKANPTVDCGVRKFYGISTNLTISDLKKLPYSNKIGRVIIEGDEYTTALISTEKGITVEVLFDPDGNFYQAKTMSPGAHDPKGIKIGSPLSEVKAAWPGGRLLYGTEHGQFVTYSTGANVFLDFDPVDMPPEAFETSRRDIKVPDIKVRAIRITSAN